MNQNEKAYQANHKFDQPQRSTPSRPKALHFSPK